MLAFSAPAGLGPGVVEAGRVLLGRLDQQAADFR